ncbi:unnamed protein product [Clavelina lepadiformis]|uniref:Uncharacterized protein n=1 Tax=Clavelina lepadiformis TaxID=159417 RepID=A0ABP0F702_CLALP
MAIRANFPAFTTSFAFAENDMKVAAAVLKCSSVLSFVTAFCLPIPNTLEVVSHPNSAWAKRRLFDTMSPRSFLVTEMFQHFDGFLVPFLDAVCNQMLCVVLLFL